MNDTDLKVWDEKASAYLQAASEKNNPFKKIFDTPSFIALLGDIRNKKILDLGCGNGDLCKQLTKKGALVVGLDGSANMIKEAKHNFKNGTYVVCDVLHEPLPFRKSSFDVVTAKMLLDIVSSMQTVSIKAMQVLKKKGLYVIEVPHPIRPFVVKKPHGYIGISDYRKEVHGIIQFSNVNFAYYHRSVSYYINELIRIGFRLLKVEEVIVDDDFVKHFPKHMDKKTFPTSWQLLFEKI